MAHKLDQVFAIRAVLALKPVLDRSFAGAGVGHHLFARPAAPAEGIVQGLSDPPFHRNFIQAYAWFVVAAGFPPQDTRRTLPNSWGTPMRAVRLLEQVLDDDERRLAHRLADYYAEKFGRQEGS